MFYAQYITDSLWEEMKERQHAHINSLRRIHQILFSITNLA